MDSVIPTDDGMFRSLCGSTESNTISSLFDCLKRREDFASQAISCAGAFGAKISLPGDPAVGGWELMEFEHQFYLAACDCDFQQNRSENVGWEGVTEFHFALSGPVSVSSDGASAKGEDLTVVICHMGHQASYQVTCAKGRRRSIALYVLDSFMETLLGGDAPDIKRLRQDLNSVGPDEVYLFQLPINRKLMPLIESIVANAYDSQRRLIFAQAKCLELLCETIAAWRTQKSTSVARLTLRPRDIDRFEKARELILSNLATVPGIPELARILATNSSKLTIGFRVLNGVTISQFTLNARMEHALTLLSQNQHSVADVAEAVGYQHQSSFTQAFSRHFGFSPSKARNLGDH